jgi:hypothetical protein
MPAPDRRQSPTTVGADELARIAELLAIIDGFLRSHPAPELPAEHLHGWTGSYRAMPSVSLHDRPAQADAEVHGLSSKLIVHDHVRDRSGRSHSPRS